MSVSMMLLQLGIEALLVVLLLIILRRTRNSGPADPAEMPEKLKVSIENFLTESEKIADVFARNLKDKKDLSTDLILKLDRRLSEYQELLRRAEAGLAEAGHILAELESKTARPVSAEAALSPVSASEGKANPAAPEVRALVLQMAKKGHTHEEIAAKARLHLGEVELIIDLERQFNV